MITELTRELIIEKLKENREYFKFIKKYKTFDRTDLNNSLKERANLINELREVNKLLKEV